MVGGNILPPMINVSHMGHSDTVLKLLVSVLKSEDLLSVSCFFNVRSRKRYWREANEAVAHQQ